VTANNPARGGRQLAKPEKGAEKRCVEHGDGMPGINIKRGKGGSCARDVSRDPATVLLDIPKKNQGRKRSTDGGP